MNCSANVYVLSPQFYTDFPHDEYPEIPIKKNRPYLCLLIKYADDTFVCVPFRSNIRHKHAYHFKDSKRSSKSQSGLDYTKTLLIQGTKYIGSRGIIDKDEYNELSKNLPKITKDIHNYISRYKDHLNGKKKLDPRRLEREYKRSTLPYFHNLLKEK